ncbi:MAG: hypothetical protein ACR2LV_12185 [Solirubrobacteraceae bacterium]
MARACGSAGVDALLVISPGFGEAGAIGAPRQHQLLEIGLLSQSRGMGIALIEAADPSRPGVSTFAAIRVAWHGSPGG